jgi:imidazoleglycerol-phosphate dehydratase
MARRAEIERKTAETRIRVVLELDGSRQVQVETGVGFFDHMLTHVAFHGGFDLTVEAAGDLHVDAHHTVEDVGIALGQALARALGDKAGVARYGAALVPMDESLARVVVDLSNRPLSLVTGPRRPGAAGGFDGQLAEEFWRALALHAGLTLHVGLLYGDNDHHLLEAAFKALGRALGQAAARAQGGVASTKGVL